MVKEWITILVKQIMLLLMLAFSMSGEVAQGVQTDPDNLTVNSGFEILSEGQPAFWKEHKKGGWKVSEE